MTRWWLTQGCGRPKKPPTSRNDSLVVLVVDEGAWEAEKATNESLELVGDGGDWQMGVVGAGDDSRLRKYIKNKN